MVRTDFLIIGGGIMGISIARSLLRRYPKSSIMVIEKESSCGLHASGRNSGVLHAGFYYTADSLKAKFTRQGNQLLTEYCDTRGLPIHKCGKLVVAKNATDLSSMDVLQKRGEVNGIPLRAITEAEAKEIEPRVKTFERALFSPTTSTVDPVQVLDSMTHEAKEEGVKIHCGVQYLKKQASKLVTSTGSYEPGYVVNAAGLYADQIARDFGFSEGYRILPFKGLYLYSDEPAGSLRTNIYPVPDLRNPFLGVHATVTVHGRSKIGPTAIPTFWREQYEGFANFNLTELLDLSVRQAGLITFSGFDFKRLAVQEIKKYSRTHLVRLASSLVEGVKPENYTKWGVPGIRAQLVDMGKRKLEMDFIVQGDDRSMHVLNAVSPGFTCSLPFSDYVCEKIVEAIK